MVQWGIRQSTEVANHLIAVERLLEYKSLPPEKQPIVPKIPPPEWPEQGKIMFRDVGLRYNDNGDLVLNSLNFTIHPKEKVCTDYYYTFCFVKHIELVEFKWISVV